MIRRSKCDCDCHKYKNIHHIAPCCLPDEFLDQFPHKETKFPEVIY